MRRKNVISRFATLVLATLACLLLAVLAPLFFGPRAAAGGPAARHGLRRPDCAPGHAARDHRGWDVGDARRHPGGADGATQGADCGQGQLHLPRTTASLRRRADTASRKADAGALA